MLKIIIDKAIPFIVGVFEPYAKVEYIEGKSFTPSIIADADALIIRTRTKCNSSLLDGSRVRFIATATIGFDHIDLEYCKEYNIGVSTSAGCNARAVLQWVAATLAHLAQSEGWCPSAKTLGVVGVGNVGSLVARYATLWGFRVICCDPPRYKAEGGAFKTLDEVAAEADIITFHTPLNSTTYHIVNAEILSKTKADAIIINSSRGEVVDGDALKMSGRKYVLDVWEKEPNLDIELLRDSKLASSHIAGYSLQGKAIATQMAVRAVAKALSLPLEDWVGATPLVEPRDIGWEEMLKTISAYMDIASESNFLKTNREKFEQIRDNYAYRTEYF